VWLPSVEVVRGELGLSLALFMSVVWLVLLLAGWYRFVLLEIVVWMLVLLLAALSLALLLLAVFRHFVDASFAPVLYEPSFVIKKGSEVRLVPYNFCHGR
jgi:hypothetical protein